MSKLATMRLIVIVLLAFGLGALVGGKSVLDDPERGLGKIINTSLGKPADVDYGLYWDVYSMLESKFPGEVDDQKLLYGAIRGAVEALGDRYSLFLTPKEADQFFEEINAEFSGIGAELHQQGDSFVIVAPLPDSPAEVAGLKPGDIITAVNGQDAKEFELGSLINAIRGPKGTEVTLKIFRESFEEPRDFTLKRDTIVLDSIKYEQREDGIAVIQLIQFSDDTLKEVTDLEDDLKKAGAKGIILDLRNNPGGFLDSAIDIASLFVRDGVVVAQQGKDGHRENFQTTMEPVLTDYPLVVLVNNGSASASEIVAGAIQDRDEGTVIGTQTFGKGSVQEVEQLEDGSALRLTVAKWLTPDGRAINGTGITPDEVVEDDEEKEGDEQLQRAVELLSK